MSKQKHIVVIGAGAFGTALALSCLKTGAQVTLYARRSDFVAHLQSSRQNDRYLPGVDLPSDLAITADLSCLKQADVVLLVTPAQKTDTVLMDLKPHLRSTTPLVICAKGMHREQKSLLSGIARRLIVNPMAVLSGPSFADELADSKPTAVMLACQDIDLAESLAQTLRHPTLRCYASEDIIGVQAAGAIKNVIAIASGIADGLTLGCNSRAALLSRGLAEMSRIGVRLGGKAETFLGLAGMGDLILTATSEKSRNYSFGLEIGRGRSIEDILATRYQVTEGFVTTAAVFEMTQQLEIYAPLTAAMNDILHRRIPISQVIEDILSKQSEREF
ncbi:MAG: NAD(P)-dependent glycerol-3-phosphate dehydrogenase [Candidatus Paracaedibacteraceae bacterium]|nr:NAD(P)-dependent glycerol-3-phosphate dehydrogenase [Candidatus Paracaedibacteraceae bacterium]